MGVAGGGGSAATPKTRPVGQYSHNHSLTNMVSYKIEIGNYNLRGISKRNYNLRNISSYSKYFDFPEG